MSVCRIRIAAYFDGTRLHERGPFLITLHEGTLGSVLPTDGQAQADIVAGFALPGLADAHVHLFLDGGTQDAQARAAQLSAGPESMLATARANRERTLRAGVTLLRDAGDAYGVNHALRAEAGPPAILSAGAGLRRAGRYGRHLAREVGGMADIPAAVAAAAREGCAIKIILTDIVDFATGAMKGPPQFDVEETRLIVREAQRHGLKTFAHCSGADGLDIALAAGVDCIEHGYFMTAGILKRMAAAGTAWVPTFAPVKAQAARPDLWDAATIARIDRILAAHAERLALAHALGVPILAGSDAGSPGVPHGSGLIDELLHMHDAGLPLAAVLHAATAYPRAHFGLPAASLQAGEAADLVLLAASPFERAGALREVVQVMKGRSMQPGLAA
jgi:imidazolonepropionase-like amidohydrolase